MAANKNLFFLTSASVPMANDFTAYVKYANMTDIADDSSWTFALAKTMKYKYVNAFADMTYTLVEGKDSLVLTAGAFADYKMFDKMNCLKASVNKNIYYSDLMTVNLGNTLKLGEDLALDLSASFDALDKINPLYKDFDVQASITFYL